MNKEWEMNARKEGYEYFDEPFDGSMKSNKYKHERYLNTAIWWFRKNKKRILVYTDMIADVEYLYTVFTKDIEAIIYYKNISENIDFSNVKKHYAKSKLQFIQIDYNPSEKAPFVTSRGKIIEYSTIVLAGNDTIIFDRKRLGLIKDEYGDRQVYRVKDRNAFKMIFEAFQK